MDLAEVKDMREIPGYEHYLISPDGRVFNTIYRNRYANTALANPTEKAQIKAKNGYMRVVLCKDGKQKYYSVHRLVLLAFKGPCPEGCEGSHLDGVRQNNSVDNLAWETRSSNHKHKKEHGTSQEGSNNPNAKLTELQVVEIKRDIASGVKQRDIAAKFDICEQSINTIKNGVRWSHVR